MRAFFLSSLALCICYFTPELQIWLFAYKQATYTNEIKNGMSPYKAVRIIPQLLF